MGAPTEWLVFLEFNPHVLAGEEAELIGKPLSEVIHARSAKQRALAGNEIAGWKIMWSTMAHMRRKLKAAQNEVLDAAFMASAFDNPKYIYFERLDKVAQAISHVILTKTRISHVRDEQQQETLENKKRDLQITNEEITNFLGKLRADEQSWNDFFQLYQIAPLHIIYEDLCDNIAGVIRDVAQFLRVDIAESVVSEIENTQTLRITRSTFEQDLAAQYLAAATLPSGTGGN
jgi:LPS sulfotransferase NodH